MNCYYFNGTGDSCDKEFESIFIMKLYTREILYGD